MTTEPSDTELAALKARVAASTRAFGKVLSVIGAVLAVIAVTILVGGGVALTALSDSVARGADRGRLEQTAHLIVGAMVLAPGLLTLFAMCGLIAGEQFRRGRITKNVNPPQTTLPSASMVSQFSMLSFAWHGLWLTVSLLLGAFLVILPVAGRLTGGWPYSVRDPFAFDGLWLIYGSIVVGIAVTCGVSLFKKVFYLRDVATGRITSAGGPGKTFWRWVDYRWRLDLWVAGLGGLLVALAPFALPASQKPTVEEIVPSIVVTACGAALIVLGLVMARQFWRTGEELGSGESAA